jgi:hypothetical protein
MIYYTGYIWKEKKALKPNPDVSLRAFYYKKIRYGRPENSVKRLAPAFTVQPPRINAA